MKMISRYCQKRKISVLLIPVFLLVTACTAIGPPTVARDRFDYVNAVSDSWKRQMLLNVVKLRYYDTPVFLEVASIINQYSLEGEVNLGASWLDADGAGGLIGGTGRYADRPTITYAPLTGEKFARNLMTPIPVRAVLHLVQAGYPVEYVFRIIVQSINGVENRFGGQLMQRDADPDFADLLTLMGRIQRSGGLGMRARDADDEKTVVIFFRGAKEAAIEREIESVGRILGIDPDAESFEIVYGSIPSSDREIAIETRSILQILAEMGSRIDISQKDIAEGRTYQSTIDTTDSTGFHELIRIHSAAARPKDAYVAVSYRGQWFWIDDRKVASKRTFAFVMLLFSLTETGDDQRAPIVTVPTN